MDKSAPSKWALEKAQKLEKSMDMIYSPEFADDLSLYNAEKVALEFDAIARERDEVTEKLVEALDFMYLYFVMPGHPERAKDCPNKDCPFCKADAALAAYRERMGR